MASNAAAAGQVAIVTGGGTGIGRAAALALLGAGWRVAVAGRRVEPLQEVVRAAPERALAVPTDMTDPDSVEALFGTTVKAFGRVDLLFNNAGTGLPAAPLEDMAVADWKRVVDTNLNGMFYGIQNAFRVMKSQQPMGGRIINNGSISAQIDIGNAHTDMAARMAKGVPQANGEIAVEPLMDVDIVGQSILYMASLPLEANVLFHTVMATRMPFVGRG